MGPSVAHTAPRRQLVCGPAGAARRLRGPRQRGPAAATAIPPYPRWHALEGVS